VANSCLSLVAPPPIITPPRRQPFASLRLGVVTAACVTGAFLLAPDQPQQQAAICERHQPAAACRVW